MNRTSLISSLFSLVSCLAFAAVPLRWTVETSRTSAQAFSVYHGETLALEASFKSYGSSLDVTGEAHLYCQTNGMGSAWWVYPAAASGSVIRAEFPPSADPGASVMNCFLGGTATTYRAAFRLNFLNSPGATPNYLPYPTIEYGDGLTPAMATNVSATVTSNIVTKSYVEGLGIEAGMTTAQVDAAIVTATNRLATKTAVSALTTTQATDHATIASWESYWSGDDVRVTVTNYDSSVHMPSLYIEYNTNAASGAAAAFKTVWSELTRWDSFLDGYATFTNNAVQNYADRAWGVYDSSTGNYSPDGLLQVSQPEIQIASGLAYQKTVTTGGCAIWVLSATEPTALSGVTTNGYFRISDGDGNALFEIVKGDKRTVGANASAVTANGNGMTITYNVVANEHPVLNLATNLINATWYEEDECLFATVTWTGSSGAYVATVTPTGSTSAMFAKSSYETGGSTYMRTSAELHLSGVTGNVYNFGNMKGVYQALRDVVQALGGSVSNYPSFNN